MLVGVERDVLELGGEVRRRCSAAAPTPPVHTPSSSAGGSKPASSSRSASASKSVSSGSCTITTAPDSDWLNSSHSAVAGEKPKCVCSSRAEPTSADAEVRSASNPASRNSCRSSPDESASSRAPTSARTSAQSVQDSRWASYGANVVARSRSLDGESRHHRTADERGHGQHQHEHDRGRDREALAHGGSCSGRRDVTLATMATKDVLAAGVVVFRPGKRVLLVHRPRYDDWSFPKGKLDPGEHPTAAAVREVAEETGLHVRLGPPLTGQRYPVAGGRMKSVYYWAGRAVGDDDVSGYRPNAEIDDVRWVPYDDALEMLSYDHDRDTLREARPMRRKTHTLVVLRHGEARSRKAWRQDDRLRPLLQHGRLQAQKLVPVLAAYDVTRVVSSSSARCVRDRGAVRRHHRLEARARGRSLRRRARPRRRCCGWSTSWRSRTRARCSAPTGRCCRRCSTRSACPTPTSSPAACWWCTCARAE